MVEILISKLGMETELGTRLLHTYVDWPTLESCFSYNPITPEPDSRAWGRNFLRIKLRIGGWYRDSEGLIPSTLQ